MSLGRKTVAVGLVAGLLAMVLVVPQVAEAGGRHWHRGGHGHHSHFRPGHFWGGLAVGAATGIIVGSIFAPRVYAAPPVVYHQPAPVYHQPAPVIAYPPPVVYHPAPVCTSHWVPTYWSGYEWVPGHWAQSCR